MFLPASTIFSHFLRILISLLLLMPVPQLADTGLSVQKNEAHYNGWSISFKLSAQSETEIASATLVHGLNSNTCLGDSQARREVEVKQGTKVELTWIWLLQESGNLPPGTSIWWQWELRDVNNALVVTERENLTLEDANLDWKKIQNGSVTILWSEGDQNFASLISQITDRSLERLSEEAGLQRTEPIRLMVYPSSWAMRGSLAAVQEWAGGVAFPQYNVVMVGIAPDELVWAREVIPHELAHLITGARIYNCTGDQLPTWFEEGLAEYATGQPSGKVREAILAALDTNRLAALTSLSKGFPGDSRLADQAYKQSHLMVEFLIDTYGGESISQVLDLVRQGTYPDTALRQVYGLDTAGLDQAWRSSLGFGEPPVPNFDLVNEPAGLAVVPTLALYVPASSMTETPTAAPTFTLAPHTATPPVPSQTPPPVEDASPDLPGPRSNLILLLIGCTVAGLLILVVTVIILRRNGRPS